MSEEKTVLEELEEIKRYIQRSRISKSANSYCLDIESGLAIRALGRANGICDAIYLSFEYGKAEGWRAAKAEAHRGNAN